MKRLARSGGKVVVADIDGNHLYRYPLDEEWEEVLGQLVSGVEAIGFDPFVGRKLYSMFRRVGLEGIQVNIMPYYLIAGGVDPTSLRVWEMKMQILAETFAKIFGSAQRVKELADRFIGDLRGEDTLFFNFLFLVQGKA